MLGESATSFREIGQRDWPARSLAWLGYAARGLGQFCQAAGYLREALRTAVEIGNRLQPLEALPAIALFLAELEGKSTSDDGNTP